MSTANAATELLHQQIADADTQWSLGTFGGIAEFSRDRDEKVSLTQSATGAFAVTARGGIAIDLSAGGRPFAFETIPRSAWSQRVALCLPAEACAMNRRTALTGLGPDHAALKPEHRGSILFDLGLGAPQADLCVRIDDPDTVAQLRRFCGQSLFDPANPAMGVLLNTNPHRVFISRIGRIEVYQPIPPASGKSPEGPHTDILPKLLNSGRPRNPVHQAAGGERDRGGRAALESHDRHAALRPHRRPDCAPAAESRRDDVAGASGMACDIRPGYNRRGRGG